MSDKSVVSREKLIEAILKVIVAYPSLNVADRGQVAHWLQGQRSVESEIDGIS